MSAPIQLLNVLLTLIKLEKDPHHVSDAVAQRLRWAKGFVHQGYWALAKEVPPTTVSTRELLESQYERGR